MSKLKLHAIMTVVLTMGPLIAFVVFAAWAHPEALSTFGVNLWDVLIPTLVLVVVVAVTPSKEKSTEWKD